MQNFLQVISELLLLENIIYGLIYKVQLVLSQRENRKGKTGEKDHRRKTGHDKC